VQLVKFLTPRIHHRRPQGMTYGIRAWGQVTSYVSRGRMTPMCIKRSPVTKLHPSLRPKPRERLLCTFGQQHRDRHRRIRNQKPGLSPSSGDPHRSEERFAHLLDGDALYSAHVPVAVTPYTLLTSQWRLTGSLGALQNPCRFRATPRD
jgi:hypothetical protein